VLVTRAREDCAPWAERLRQAGARAVTLACIECHPIEEPSVRQRLAEALPDADWLVVTSRRGAEALGRLLAETGCGARDGGTAIPVPVAAVGPSTAAAARRWIGRADLVSEGSGAAPLARMLVRGLIRDREQESRTRPPGIVLALAENAGPALEEILTEAGARCVRIDVYRTLPVPAGAARRPVSQLGVNTVLLASPSAVTGLVHQVEFDVPVEVVTIGPSTSARARTAGLTVAAEAESPSLDGLMEAMS
jgi:uroporphyrinogen-III synthase